MITQKQAHSEDHMIQFQMLILACLEKTTNHFCYFIYSQMLQVAYFIATNLV